MNNNIKFENKAFNGEVVPLLQTWFFRVSTLNCLVQKNYPQKSGIHSTLACH